MGYQGWIGTYRFGKYTWAKGEKRLFFGFGGYSGPSGFYERLYSFRRATNKSEMLAWPWRDPFKLGKGTNKKLPYVFPLRGARVGLAWGFRGPWGLSRGLRGACVGLGWGLHHQPWEHFGVFPGVCDRGGRPFPGCTWSPKKDQEPHCQEELGGESEGQKEQNPPEGAMVWLLLRPYLLEIPASVPEY